MSQLYFLLSLKVAITIKVLQDQEYAPRSWLKFLPLLHESHFDEKQKSFFFPSNFEKVAESQNGIFIFVPCLSKNCPNASELFDYLCNLL